MAALWRQNIFHRWALEPHHAFSDPFYVSRVPDSPKDALAMGLDVEAWLKKGLLDAVIAGNGAIFSGLDLEAWVALAHRYHTPVYGSLERIKIRKSFSRYGTPETLRAAAATLWEKGADGLYFFNFYLRDEMPLFDEFSDRAKLAELPKEYFCDIDMRSGGPWSSLGEAQLVTLKPSTPATVHLVIADDPAKAKEASLEILFKSEGETEAPAITLNGQSLKKTEIQTRQRGLHPHAFLRRSEASTQARHQRLHLHLSRRCHGHLVERARDAVNPLRLHSPMKKLII